LLRYLLLGNGAEATAPALSADGPETVRTQALASMSPWVRRAAALNPARASLPFPALQSAGGAGAVDRTDAGDRDMAMDYQEFERIIALKRMPLFRYVPFDIVAEVARSVQVRTYLAGEEVIAPDTRRQDLLILEAGALTIAQRDGDHTLAAPGCFGEVALCGERMAWPRITALENARVSFLRTAIFEELCREHPEIAIELCRLLARRLRAAGEAPPGTPMSA
jgi:Cyclic nucleotide-binding domain